MIMIYIDIDIYRIYIYARTYAILITVNVKIKTNVFISRASILNKLFKSNTIYIFRNHHICMHRYIYIAISIGCRIINIASI